MYDVSDQHGLLYERSIMTAFLGKYAIALSAASIISGIILSLVKSSGHETLVRLLCGIFLTVTALKPLSGVRIPEISQWEIPGAETAEQAVRYGERMGEDALSGLIKERTEAYILREANIRDMELEVNVQVVEGIPKTVEVRGVVSPEKKLALMRIITDELGISEEYQQWIGGN